MHKTHIVLFRMVKTDPNVFSFSHAYADFVGKLILLSKISKFHHENPTIPY